MYTVRDELSLLCLSEMNLNKGVSQWLNGKVFYLLLYSIAHRTLSLLLLKAYF